MAGESYQGLGFREKRSTRVRQETMESLQHSHYSIAKPIFGLIDESLMHI